MLNKLPKSTSMLIALSLFLGACSNPPEKNVPVECEGGTALGPNTTLEVRSDGRSITLHTKRKETTEIFSADPPAFVSTTENYYTDVDYVVDDHDFSPKEWERVERTGVPRTNATWEYLKYVTLEICLYGDEVFVRNRKEE